MWLTTEDGFYSIADKSTEGSDYACVRSHDEASLIRMRDRIVEFAKTNDRSVYVKTGAEDGLMYRGRFWIGKREHYEDVPDRGDEYEWRMSTPRDLLMAYFNLAVTDLTYVSFEDRCRETWRETCNSDIVQRRMITLEEVAYRFDLLWPKQSHKPVARRPLLTMVHGGTDDDSDTAGV